MQLNMLPYQSGRLTHPIKEKDKSFSSAQKISTSKSQKSSESAKPGDYPELQPALASYMEMRKAKRNSPTPQALKLIVTKLREFHPGDAQKQQRCLDNATAGGFSVPIALKEVKTQDKPVDVHRMLYPERYKRQGSAFSAGLATQMGVR